MLGVIAYLTEECCAGHPEACGLLPAGPGSASRAEGSSPCCGES